MLEKSWATQEVEYISESDHDSEFTFVSIERTLLAGKSEIRQDVEVAFPSISLPRNHVVERCGRAESGFFLPFSDCSSFKA